MTPRLPFQVGFVVALMSATTVALAGPPATKPLATKAPAVTKPALKAQKPKPPVPSIAAKTPGATVGNLVKAMKKQDKEAIATAFDWQRFAAEMNKLVPDKQGLAPEVYKTLLVETFNVGEDISKDVRVGKVTPMGKDKATVEMERLLPVSEAKNAIKKFKTINILSLYKSPSGWRIYRLDSAKEPPIPMPKPVPTRASEGMVPAAGSGKPTPPTPAPVVGQ